MQIVCGHFIANVMMQVVERHILRNFDNVFPTEVEDGEIEKLTVEDPNIERLRAGLVGRQKQVRDLLDVLQASEGR